MNSVEILRPDLDAIPQALKSRDAWVLWQITKDGKKVPFCPKTQRPANITSPDQSSNFNTAVDVYKSTERYSGVGVVFTGDGFVGIDIDDCVTDGIVDEHAIQLLEDLNCSYVEYSPSGTGLHGYGVTDRVFAGIRGTLGHLKIEIYCEKRYFTVTGRPLIGYVQRNAALGLCDLHDLVSALHICNVTMSLYNASQEAQDSQESQDIQEPYVSQHLQEVQASSGCYTSIEQNFPAFINPQNYGERNNHLFKLARYLKGMYPDASFEDHIPRVKEWFDKNIDHIETKDFGITLAEFRYGLHKVKLAYGEVLKKALASQAELPEWMLTQPYGPNAERLLKICFALSRYHAPDPFFLSNRTAEKLINIHHTHCGRLLRALVLDGYLERIDEGTRQLAATYRICEPVKTPEEQDV